MRFRPHGQRAIVEHGSRRQARWPRQAATHRARLTSSVPSGHTEALALSSEAQNLASAYIEDGAIGPRMQADALHIALATVARVDVLVSWNFKHIVNLRQIRAYNAVNLKNGYPVLEIRVLVPKILPPNCASAGREAGAGL